MSSHELPQCKPRFKGVESFLRRVAFNLGNTPSATEVKIISCIPIDVTDLQQKIVELEKQLDEAKRQDHPEESSGPVVQTALCRPNYSSRCKPAEAHPPRHEERCEGCSAKRSTSGISPCGITFSPHLPYEPPKSQACACWSDASNADNRRKCLFKKKNKPTKKKDKCKTQLVYYTQTTNNPFSTYLDEKPAFENNIENSPADEIISREYISEMIRKQYTHVPMVQDVSAMSEFSSPICRDVENIPISIPHDSDLCSCCHGTFHNIDNHSNHHIQTNLPTCSFNDCAQKTSFYDSSLYDMVPVREKPAKNTPRRKSPKNNLCSPFYPEEERSQSKMHSLILNYQSRTPVVSSSRRPPRRVYRYNKKDRVSRISPKRDNQEILKLPETSTSCLVDCSNVYMKRIIASSNIQPLPAKAVSQKNAECLTTTLNSTECQTTTSQSVQIDGELLEEKKTEETLNQIKSILQSVLTEVKTNSQLKKVEDKSTKDAVVQKGQSQGTMPGGSSLLNSYTYSPYNMNPYLASCSRQMSSGPCYYSGVPYASAKCMHNFPVFIQTPGRQMCAGCYRNSSHVPKMEHAKQATTAATNTDVKERSKETEKLIKEIYKSMTVNMEFPSKDTSASENNYLKSTPRNSVNKSLYRPSVLDEGMKKFMKANASRNTQQTASPVSVLNSKLVSNTMSMRSQIVSTTDTERRLRNHRLENYLETADAHRRQHKIEEEKDYRESEESTASDDDETSSETEEVRVTYVPVEEPSKKTKSTKKGLFSKMFKSVKLFGSKNKKREEQVQVENEIDDESEDDSDDYQTVYSQRVDRTPRHMSQRVDRPRYTPYPVRSVRSPHKMRAHSKISYSRQMRGQLESRKSHRNPEVIRKSPYMEQEYRRHWNENFMLRENQKYSSETPYSEDIPTRPVYWQNYEARSALVGRHPNQPFVPPANHVSPKMVKQESSKQPNMVATSIPKANATAKGFAWLKKHKLGIHCGEQWKKFVLEG